MDEPSMDEPATVGAKVTVAVTDCPAASVEPATGSPVTENGAATLEIELSVSGEPPLLAICTFSNAVLPTGTFPKGSVTGVTESTPGCGAMPVPVSEMEPVPPELTIEREPVAALAKIGAKVTVAVTA